MQYLLEKPIIEFIPQRPPFVLVDRIIECNKDFTLSTFKVESSHLLCVKGLLQEGGLIENIAQTAAAGHGLYMRSQNKKVVRGFIGAVKKLKIYSLPKQGTELITKVENVSQVMSVNIVSGNISDSQGNRYAECEMNIFLEN